MQINVKDPQSGVLLTLEAKPERWHNVQGFRIIHPDGSNFWISSHSGAWQAEDGRHIDSQLLINIGLALEHHPYSEQLESITSNRAGHE